MEKRSARTLSGLKRVVLLGLTSHPVWAGPVKTWALLEYHTMFGQCIMGISHPVWAVHCGNITPCSAVYCGNITPCLGSALWEYHTLFGQCIVGISQPVRAAPVKTWALWEYQTLLGVPQ